MKVGTFLYMCVCGWLCVIVCYYLEECTRTRVCWYIIHFCEYVSGCRYINYVCIYLCLFMCELRYTFLFLYLYKVISMHVCFCVCFFLFFPCVCMFYVYLLYICLFMLICVRMNIWFCEFVCV